MNTTYRRATPKPGKVSCKLYRAWQNMRSRCAGTAHDGRGNRRWKGLPITKEWDDYAAFREWSLQNGFSKTKISLDRISRAQGYEPNNCQWVTKAENCRKAVQYRESKKRPA